MQLQMTMGFESYSISAGELLRKVFVADFLEHQWFVVCCVDHAVHLITDGESELYLTCNRKITSKYYSHIL